MAMKKTAAATSFLFSKRTEYKGRGSLRNERVDRVLGILLLLAGFFGTSFVWPFAADVHQYPKYLVFCLLTLIAGVWWLSKNILGRMLTVVSFPGARTLPFFVGGVFLSILFASDRTLAFFGNPDQVGLSGVAIVSFVLFLFLAIQCVASTDMIRRVVNGFLVLSLFSFVVFLCRAFLPLGGFFPRMGLSLFGYPVSLSACFAVVGILLTAARVLFSSEKRSQQVLLWLGLAVSSGVLVLIGHRFAWFGVAVGLAFLLGIRLRTGWRLRPAATVVTTVLLLLGFGAGIFGMPSSFRLAVPEEGRITVAETWSVVSQTVVSGVKPFLLGDGFGSFPHSFARFRPESANLSDHFSIVITPASGVLLGFLADGGVLVFLCILLFFLMSGRAVVSFVGDAIRVLFEKNQSQTVRLLEHDAAMTIGLVAALLGGAVASFALPPTFVVLLLLVLLYTALLVLAARQKTSPRVFTRWLSIPAFRICLLLGTVLVGLSLTAALLCRGIAEFWYGRGIRAYANGTVALARDHATAAARLLPGDHRVALALAQATIAMAEKADPASSLREDADRMIRVLINDAAEDPAVLLGAASAASRLAQTTPTAASLVRDALLALDRIAPQNPALQMLLGDAYAQGNDPKAAVDRYARAVALRPGFVDAYLHWAQLAATNGDVETAIDLGSQAARIAPSARDPLVFLVNVALARRGPGDEQRAILALQTLLALDPDDEQVQTVLAGVFESTGRLLEAQTLYQSLEKAHPENVSFAQSLSRIDAALATARASSTPR
jgi:tetratricopeptide (TPR) repeat protein